VITEFAVPTANSNPFAITVGPDGNLWFTENAVAQIGTINVTSHAITEFATPRQRSAPVGITLGPDHNLWFLEETGSVAQAVLGTPATAPDLALSGTAPDVATVGKSLAYTISVTNNGTAGATGVTLADTLPSGATFDSATSGVVPTNGVLTFHVGDLGAGATAKFKIVVTPTAPGRLVNQATVSMSQNDSTPADNSIVLQTVVTQPAGGDGPTVTSVQRFGIHHQPTTLVLTFDEPLDPQRAENLDNYRIVQLGQDPRPIRFSSAVYDAALSTVTLRPSRRLNFHRRFRLTVSGNGPRGLSDTLGRLLDGQQNGDPGSDFVTIVTARNLVAPSPDRASRGSHPIARAGTRSAQENIESSIKRQFRTAPPARTGIRVQNAQSSR
jgi:uncharacterized repeat protein (TIGR01451 family)